MPSTSAPCRSSSFRARLLPFLQQAGLPATPEKLLQVTPLIRERIKFLSDVHTAADFFFVEQLPPYDWPELIPQKGDAALARRILAEARELLAATPVRSRSRSNPRCARPPRVWD